jgi:hypothetical protein
MARHPLRKPPSASSGASSARKGSKVTPEEKPPSTGRLEPAATRFTVDSYRLQTAREFVTVPPDSPLWSGKKPCEADWTKGGKELPPPGSFVRVQPPVDAPDSLIGDLRVLLEREGRIVVVLPKPRTRVVTEAATPEPIKTSSIRDVVMTMVEEANTQDRDALRTVIETALSEVGL